MRTLATACFLLHVVASPAAACILYQPQGCDTRPWNVAGERALLGVSAIYQALASFETGRREAREQLAGAVKLLEDSQKRFADLRTTAGDMLNKKLIDEALGDRRAEFLRHFEVTKLKRPTVGKDAIDLAAAELENVARQASAILSAGDPSVQPRLVRQLQFAVSRFMVTGTWLSDLFAVSK